MVCMHFRVLPMCMLTKFCGHAVETFEKIANNLNIDQICPFSASIRAQTYGCRDRHLHTTESTFNMPVNQLLWSHNKNVTIKWPKNIFFTNFGSFWSQQESDMPVNHISLSYSRIVLRKRPRTLTLTYFGTCQLKKYPKIWPPESIISKHMQVLPICP